MDWRITQGSGWALVLPPDVDERDMVSAPLFTPSPAKDKCFPSIGWMEHVGEGMRPADVYSENLTRADFAQVHDSFPDTRSTAPSLVRNAAGETFPSKFTAVRVRMEADFTTDGPAAQKAFLANLLADLLEHVISKDARPLYLAGGRLPPPPYFRQWGTWDRRVHQGPLHPGCDS